jgi:hypothetical protein
MSYIELKKIINFFYNINYDNKILKETENKTRLFISLLQLYARIFILENRYDIPDLRNTAVKKYSSRAIVPDISLELLESIYDIYKRTPTSV